MPLQIRRGTDAERLAMTVPLAEGELLYVTNTQKIYVGNGTTLAGSLTSVTGYTDNDAKDAAAAIFTSGSHSGIGFSYNTATNIITATVDLSDYSGTINASSFKGTLVADDSTMLIDAIDGKINLDGTVKGNIVPDINEAYDLGSASNRFRDLYLSGSSIELGSATITAVGSAVNLPAGSTVDGTLIGVGSGDGVIPGSNYSINIVGDDSTIIVDSSTKNITATSGFFGNIFTNLIDSADSSAILITPLVNLESDLNIGNDLFVNQSVFSGAGFFGNLNGNVNGNVTGNIFTNLIDSIDSSAIIITPTLILESDLNVGGTLSLTQDIFAGDGFFNNLQGNLILNFQNITGFGNITTTGNINTTGNHVVSGDVKVRTISGQPDVPNPTGMIYTGSDFTFGSPDGLGRDGKFTLVSNTSTAITACAEFKVHNDTINGVNVAFIRSRGNQNAKTALIQGDIVSNFVFGGEDSTSFGFAGAIECTVAGPTSSGIVPGRLTFKTTNTAGALLSAAQIEPNGSFVTNFGFNVGIPQDLGDAGSVSLVRVTSRFTTATSETATLAAGVEGQIKHLIADDVTAGNMVITVTNPGWSGSGTITFSTTGSGCQLQYTNNKWFCIGNNGALFG